MKKFEIELLTDEEVLSQLMCDPELYGECWPSQGPCYPCSPCSPGM